MRFYSDSNSESGWKTETVTVTPPDTVEDGAAISRLAAFYQDNLLNTLVYFPNRCISPAGGGGITVDGLFGIPGELGSGNILLLDSTGVLYLTQGFELR